MLGLENPIHMIFLLVVLLLVFGAKRLPEMGRSLGSGMRGFRESLLGETGQATALEQPPTASSPWSGRTHIASGRPDPTPDSPTAPRRIVVSKP
jgi:sec-independent protein translocase protein TatA